MLFDQQLPSPPVQSSPNNHALRTPLCLQHSTQATTQHLIPIAKQTTKHPHATTAHGYQKPGSCNTGFVPSEKEETRVSDAAVISATALRQGQNPNSSHPNPSQTKLSISPEPEGKKKSIKRSRSFGRGTGVETVAIARALAR